MPQKKSETKSYSVWGFAPDSLTGALPLDPAGGSPVATFRHEEAVASSFLVV